MTSLLSLAKAPLSQALRGADAPPKSDRTLAIERIDRMRALDTQRLKEKVEKGDADEEQVTALVKELCACLLAPLCCALPLSLPAHLSPSSL